MKNKIDLALYNSLIKSDFFLLSSSAVKKSPYLNANIKITGLANYSTLDIVELTKSIKQFIRVLQIIQLQDNLGVLHIIVKNKQYLHLLKQFFIEYPTKIKINIESTISSKKLVSTKVLQAVLLLDSFNSENLSILKKLQSNNIFLINKINSKLEMNNFGTYKIYNDLFDFKKVIFLAVLINKIFTKN